MFRSKTLLAAFFLAGSMLVFADDAAKPHHHTARLTKPWSELSSLSDDQKRDILTIHAKANEQIKAINLKEHADILALLNDDQKRELGEIEEKHGGKASNNGSTATTKPSAENTTP